MNLEEKRALHREAIAFYELAEYGRKHFSAEKFVENSIPYIVNMTFCTELMLKLLLIHNGWSVNSLKKIGHDLYRLYDNLSQEQKIEIYQLFKRPLVYCIPDELNNINNAFIEWRYLVLNKANNNVGQLHYKPYFIKELNEVLDKICKNILKI